MSLKEKNLTCNTLAELPDLVQLKTMPRGMNLIITFGPAIENHREQTGEKWRKQLPDFSIGIHLLNNTIDIYKLITDEEIAEHQLFFEECAKEYGILAERLIHTFIKEFKVEPHGGYPLKTLNPYGNTSYQETGVMGEWEYFFHGFHCEFTHTLTGQCIEVPLTFGEEYGELDPYFFTKFIKTTPKFTPLPVEIYDDFSDGERILDTMVKLGAFEVIGSNLESRVGVIVKDRAKKVVRVFEYEQGPGIGGGFWDRLKGLIFRRRW